MPHDLELVTQIDAENPVLGDLKLTNGQLTLVGGHVFAPTEVSPEDFQKAVAQHLLIRLRFFLGEWFLDTEEGIPYFQQILEKGVDLEAVNSIYRRVILSTPGIESINFLTLDLDGATRVLTPSFECRLNNGLKLQSSDFGRLLAVEP